MDAASVDVLDALQRLVGELSSSAAKPHARDLEAIIESPVTTMIVARDQSDEVIGMLTLALFRIPTGLRAWIEDVVVDKRARGEGVGEALTREAIRIANERGARTIDLTSNRSREAANRMYRKLGFNRRDTTVYRIDSTSASGGRPRVPRTARARARSARSRGRAARSRSSGSLRGRRRRARPP